MLFIVLVGCSSGGDGGGRGPIHSAHLPTFSHSAAFCLTCCTFLTRRLLCTPPMESSQLTRTFFLPLPCESKKLFLENRLECDPPCSTPTLFFLDSPAQAADNNNPSVAWPTRFKLSQPPNQKLPALSPDFFSLSPPPPSSIAKEKKT